MASCMELMLTRGRGVRDQNASWKLEVLTRDKSLHAHDQLHSFSFEYKLL